MPVRPAFEPTADSSTAARILHQMLHMVRWVMFVGYYSLVFGDLLGVLNVVASAIYLFVIPYQAAFEADVSFNGLYILGSMLDAIVLTHWVKQVYVGSAPLRSQGRPRWSALSRFLNGCLRRADGADDEATGVRAVRAEGLAGPVTSGKRWQGAARQIQERTRDAHRRSLSRSRRRVLQLLILKQLAKLAVNLPADALLWGSDAQHVIPYIRMIKLLLAPMTVHECIVVLERSQAISFSICRLNRIVGFFITMSHWLGCVRERASQPAINPRSLT